MYLWYGVLSRGNTKALRVGRMLGWWLVASWVILGVFVDRISVCTRIPYLSSEIIHSPKLAAPRLVTWCLVRIE